MGQPNGQRIREKDTEWMKGEERQRIWFVVAPIVDLQNDLLHNPGVVFKNRTLVVCCCRQEIDGW